jgi:hypothetical protein
VSDAKTLRAELDQLNADRVALDQQIERDRERLAEMNRRASALEIEFQRVNAAEEQAALGKSSA